MRQEYTDVDANLLVLFIYYLRALSSALSTAYAGAATIFNFR